MTLCFDGFPEAKWYCRAALIAVSTASEPPQTRYEVFKFLGVTSASFEQGSTGTQAILIQF